MIMRNLLLAVLLFLLTVFQISFMAHFTFFGFVLNLVFLFVVLFNLWESNRYQEGLMAGLIAGFYMDVFSFSGSYFFGFYTLVFIILSIFIQFVVNKYVQIPFRKKRV